MSNSTEANVSGVTAITGPLAHLCSRTRPVTTASIPQVTRPRAAVFRYEMTPLTAKIPAAKANDHANAIVIASLRDIAPARAIGTPRAAVGVAGRLES